MKQEPFTNRISSLLKETGISSFSEQQYQTILDTTFLFRPFKKQPIDIRGVFKFWNKPRYFVFLGGKDTRNNNKNGDQNKTNRERSGCRKPENKLINKLLISYMILPIFLFSCILIPLFLCKHCILHILPNDVHIWDILFFWSNQNGYNINHPSVLFSIIAATCSLLLGLIALTMLILRTNQNFMAEKIHTLNKSFADKICQAINKNLADEPLTQSQITAVKETIIKSNPLTIHTIDIRGSIPFFSNYFFVILFGKERRKRTDETRLEPAYIQDKLAKLFFLLFVFSPLFIIAAFICLYFIKAGIGASLFPLSMQPLKLTNSDIFYFILISIFFSMLLLCSLFKMKNK